MESASSVGHCLPLEGIKVVEIAQGVAGPSCGRILASLGASVVKVEPLESGDWSRSVGPFISTENSLESSALFLYNNTGKKSVTLNWQTRPGFHKLIELVSQSDILIEDWDVQDRKSPSFDLDIFFREHPDLIELSITPFG